MVAPDGTVDVGPEGAVVADEGTDDPPLVGLGEVDGVEDEGMEGVR